MDITFLELLKTGLAAGLIATLAMTISQYTEMKINKRTTSITPLLAVSKLFGFNINNIPIKKQLRLSNAVHYVYGTIWGIPLLLFSFLFDLKQFIVIFAAYFLIIWGQSLLTLNILKVAPPIWTWEKRSIYIDVIHHFVYALTIALIYYFLFITP